MDIKKRTTKHRTNTYSHNGSNNKQRINNNRTTALGQQPKLRGGGLNAFYWYQIFALDSAIVEVQEMFSSQVSSLCKNVSCLCKNVSILYKIVSSVY